MVRARFAKVVALPGPCGVDVLPRNVDDLRHNVQRVGMRKAETSVLRRMALNTGRLSDWP